MEARVGFEPTNRGFADPSLTTWVPRHLVRKKWSGRRDSNPRPPAWQADVLPLNYARILAQVHYQNVKNLSTPHDIFESRTEPLRILPPSHTKVHGCRHTTSIRLNSTYCSDDHYSCELKKQFWK